MMFMAVMIVRRSRAAGCWVTISEKALLFDLEARLVDRAVGAKTSLALSAFSCVQRIQRQLQLFLDAAAHLQDIIAQFAQLAVKVGAMVMVRLLSRDRQPRRPVM